MSFIFNKPLDLLDERYDQMKLLIYSFSIWCTILIAIDRKVHFKNLPKKLQNDIKNRLVSMLHGVLLFWLSSYSLYNNFAIGSNEMNTQEHQFIIIISISYFIYDLLNCIYYDICDLSLVLHHTLAVLGYSASVYSKYGGGAVMTGIMVAEVSNFPMHLRMILKNVNRRYTKLYEACEIIYMILYIFFRGVVCPYLVYQVWREPLCPTIVKISCTGLSLQSFYYIKEMKNILKRLRRQQKERRKQGIHYHWTSIHDQIWTLSYTRQNSQKDKIF